MDTTASATWRDFLSSLGVSIRYVTEPEEARAILAELEGYAGPVAVDVETGATPRGLLYFAGDEDPRKRSATDPRLCELRLVQLYAGGDEVVVFDVRRIGLDLLRPSLESLALVGYAVTFDAKVLLRRGVQLTRVDDVALAAGLDHRYLEPIPRRTLDGVAAHYLGVEPPPTKKAMQQSDFSADTLTEEQIAYAAADAVLTLRCWEETEGVRERSGRAYQIAADALLPAARMELAGMPIDAEAHLAIADEWKKILAREAMRFEELTGLKHTQAQKFVEQLEERLPPELAEAAERTPTGRISLKKDDALILVSDPWVAQYVRVRALQAAYSNFGHKLQSLIHPLTGRIHGSFRIASTIAGRTSGSSPNLQNQPKGLFRRVYRAPQGRVLLVSDYSGVELRVAALVAQEETLIEAFGNDPYLPNGERNPEGDPHEQLALGLGLESDGTKDGDDRRRRLAKNCIAAGCRVLTDRGLVPIEQVSPADRIWDGVDWVTHEGVVYQGIQEVLTYGGLTATADHETYLESGDVCTFGEAARWKRALSCGGNGGTPVRFLARSERTLSEVPAEWGEDVVRRLPMSGDRGGETRRRTQSPSREVNHVAQGFSTAERLRGPEEAVASGPVLGVVEPVSESPEHGVLLLRGGGNRDAVFGCRSLDRMDTRSSSAPDLSRRDRRSSGASRALRAGEPGARDIKAEQPTHPTNLQDPLSRVHPLRDGAMGDASARLSRLPPFSAHDDTEDPRGEDGRGDSRHEGARTVQTAPVYDIVNAGPRHRFTVENVVVSNCNFGLLYLMGARKFATYAGIPLDQATEYVEGWRQLRATTRAWQLHTANEVTRTKIAYTAMGRTVDCTFLDKKLGRRLPYASRACNVPIQGSAAEAFNIAFATCDRRLREEGLDAFPIAIVHDELVLEASEADAPRASEILAESMRHGFREVFEDFDGFERVARFVVDTPDIKPTWGGDPLDPADLPEALWNHLERVTPEEEEELNFDVLLPARRQPKASPPTEPLVFVPERLERWLWYVAERDRIQAGKESGAPAPWTDNEILQTHSFCCNRREDDRVSREVRRLCRDVVDGSRWDWLAVLIARVFNTPEAIQALADAFPRDEIDPDALYAALTGVKLRGAYRINSTAWGKRARALRGSDEKSTAFAVAYGLTALAQEHEAAIAAADSLEGMTHALQSIPGVGKFLAFQIAIDLRWMQRGAAWRDKDDWAVAGPGALNGLALLARRGDEVGYAEREKLVDQAQALEAMHRLRQLYRDRLGLDLILSDVQNTACEARKFLDAELLGRQPKTRRKRYGIAPTAVRGARKKKPDALRAFVVEATISRLNPVTVDRLRRVFEVAGVSRLADASQPQLEAIKAALAGDLPEVSGPAHALLGPSSAIRWLTCPGSVQASAEAHRYPSVHTTHGDRAHMALEWSLRLDVPPERVVDTVEWPEVPAAVALVLDYIKTLPSQLHLETRLEVIGAECWGTADVIAVDDASLTVLDYKHGKEPVAVAGKDGSLNEQLLAYAVGARRRFGRRSFYRLVIAQPRIKTKRDPIVEVRVDDRVLDEFEQRLADAVAAVHATPERRVAGSHCRWCPARDECDERG